MSRWVVVFGFVGCSGGNNLVYEDTNNYTYSGSLTVTPIEVAPQSDLTIDWSSLDTDIRVRPIDPSTIEQLTIVGFSGPFDEILPLVETNEIGQSDAQDIYLFENETSAVTTPLSDFSITGIDIDLNLLTVDPDTTWFMSLLNAPSGRTDILSSLLIVPTEGSTNTAVTFTNESARLDVEVDLHSAPRLTAEAGKRYTFDWTAATTDVFGHSFDDQLGDEIIIGHYDTTDMAEVEAEFLRLDTSATELYRANVFGLRVLSLDTAVNEEGGNFEGFTAEGTWLLGIICTTCTTPIPLVLTAMEVK